MKKIVFLVFLFQLLFAQNTFSVDRKIDLSGKWNFALDESDRGVAEKWYKKVLKDEVCLPGSLVDNLKGEDISLTTKFTASIYDSSWYFNPRMEKYRQLGNIKVPFWLTQNKYYVGAAWYQRLVNVPSDWKGQEVFLNLERVHFISRVWINNVDAGTFNSLTVPHLYRITDKLKPGKNIITIRVDNRMKDIDVGANSHSVTDHTQGNWNGIVGKIELKAFSPLNFDDIQVFPDLKTKTAKLKIIISNPQANSHNGKIILNTRSFNSDIEHVLAPVIIPFKVKKNQKSLCLETVLNFGDKMQTWDEFVPALYELQAVVETADQRNERKLQFGMREISTQSKYFYVNGHKTMLRGTVENALFPLTGYPPMDVNSWERVFRICKSFGLNHMRFHSYCPPEAAFVAADKIGFYLQAEGPSWPNHSTQLGRGLPIDKYLMDETIAITKQYGNYASFTFLAAGNEPRGAWVPWVTKFVNFWKERDNRRVYTGASVGQGWAWQPANQFHVKAGARGLDWKSSRPESLGDFRDRIDSIAVPYVSHETGQWCAFPDFDEIKKYTGATRAKNFELFQEDLADNDMADLSHEFLMSSGKLQFLCYKHEIERTLRTPGYAGFQLLGLNDFSGQGTALVGVLNAFWEEKGYATAADFKQFCNSVVPLIRMEKFVFRANETLNSTIEIANFEKMAISNTHVIWKIKDSYGLVLKSGKFYASEIPVGANNEIAKLQLDLSQFAAPAKLTLEISVDGTEFCNHWNFWVYPANLAEVEPSDIYVVDTLNDKAIELLKAGGKVLLTAAGKIEYGKEVQQYYTPVFWNTSWFKMRPPHTTGVFINHFHPVFKDFVTDSWGDMQWWELINRSQTMLLTDFPAGFRPIVQPIDTWFINRKLGMLLEANVGGGKLLITTIDITDNLDKRPVASQLRFSIINYMRSQAFRPQQNVPIQNIKDLFEKRAEPINFFTKGSPDELKKDVK